MPKTRAFAVAKAGAKVQRAQKKVAVADKALAKARKAQDQAEFEHMELVKETLPAHLQRAVTQPRAVAEQTSA